jgi:hypothetical protein
MATYDDSAFRAQFPEFADVTKYPAAQIGGYWSMASMFISATESPYVGLSGGQLVAALNMLTAHLLTLGLAATTGSGGLAGKTGGMTVSASVGEVSIAKLAPPVENGWQWWLASTPYGQMLWAMLSLLSAGGFSVGGLPEREGFRKVYGVFF